MVKSQLNPLDRCEGIRRNTVGDYRSVEESEKKNNKKSYGAQRTEFPASEK